MVCVLVVDSDPQSRAEILRALEGRALTLVEAESAAHAQALIEARLPQLVIVDAFLPDQSGFAVCREIRERPSSRALPVLVLTRGTSDTDRILALEAGADDVVARPFYPRELALRVRSLLRRAESRHDEDAGQVLEHGPLRLDPRRRSALVSQTALSLTETEFALLALLLSKPGRVFSREEILSEIWPENGIRTRRVVDTHMKGIRRKLGGAAWIVESLHGVGYRLAILPGAEQ